MRSGAGGHRVVVPEVTFCVRGLECAPVAAQAGVMSERLKILLSPLNFAGYLAWAAIGWELLFSRWASPAWLMAPVPVALLACMHLAFLVLFMAVSSGPDGQQPLKRLMLVLQLLLALALMALARNSSLPILLILCVVQVVHLWTPRTALALIVAINLAMYAIYREIWQLNSPMVTTLMHMSFQGFAALTAWFAFNAERSRDELAAVNADLLATRSLLAESARDSERLRLSRELHDVAGHKLTALKLNLSALGRDPRLKDHPQVALCAQLADELLQDLRGVVKQMRLHDGLDLRAAIEKLAAPFPRPRIALEIAEDARVASLEQAEAVLRAVQEGLTNAAKHSQAMNLWIVLRRESGQIHLEIRDDGRSRQDISEGHGLLGMRERFAAIGGGLAIGRSQTGGVCLSAWLPVLA